MERKDLCIRCCFKDLRFGSWVREVLRFQVFGGAGRRGRIRRRRRGRRVWRIGRREVEKTRRSMVGVEEQRPPGGGGSSSSSVAHVMLLQPLFLLAWAWMSTAMMVSVLAVCSWHRRQMQRRREGLLCLAFLFPHAAPSSPCSFWFFLSSPSGLSISLLTPRICAHHLCHCCNCLFCVELSQSCSRIVTNCRGCLLIGIEDSDNLLRLLWAQSLVSNKLCLFCIMWNHGT